MYLYLNHKVFMVAIYVWIGVLITCMIVYIFDCILKLSHMHACIPSRIVYTVYDDDDDDDDACM